MWIYKTNENNSARYVLGEITQPKGKTLLCFGINPSTASPECLDNTIRKVVRISRNNGYENWIMLNVYPQRATDPNNLHAILDEELHKANILHIKQVAKDYSDCDILLAYGNLIDKRAYLKNCLRDILDNLQGKKVKVIKTTKLNHPVHPLYQKDESKLVDFYHSSY